MALPGEVESSSSREPSSLRSAWPPRGDRESFASLRAQVEELALQSMIRSREEDLAAAPGVEDPQQILGQMDDEAAINQTELQLSIRDYEEEMEEEEESDS
ncbi:snRNA-activating protein complex subunit 5 [Meleagris gallopavo]|uniref:snRNA-activating protein complex subunit 5 n=1 Tax=Meleagris gallopavo TaxID=9103 RepID=UPI000549A1FC|nr:snRNA-activating protein complex subunit 5 [Meleagris gallopavo]